MSEAPKVYCPKDKKKVPVWYCIGSFFQKRKTCPHWTGKASIDVSKDFAKVECSFKGE
jgi:nitrite reductase/ring-hydroxylating ferredoxin subunit